MLTPLPGQSVQKTFESTVNEVLNDARSRVGLSMYLNC